ncbi:MAG: peptide-methionine (S)-S-oxide reductase MsrA [Nitrospirae bacterium]|nr:peptide-methionine (S)-S-oxide reductase MsrA [Magnetococcales bacterium]HAT51211.1 peptide-methionine (S)-S-oxide reductase [Alphaproteobacteria bacterium]
MKIFFKPYSVILFSSLCLASIGIRSAFAENKAIATFAGGCFWCVEALFDAIPGVLATTSGYCGGTLANPTYHQVSSGGTGHTEAVQVVYDEHQVRYAKLLRQFWINIDPTTAHGQFCDHGDQYRPEIFVHTPDQRLAAETTLRQLQQSKPFPESVAVAITDAKTFYPAEESHQDYHHKNPLRYQYYRFNCGRDNRLKSLWDGYDSNLLIKGIAR